MKIRFTKGELKNRIFDVIKMNNKFAEVWNNNLRVFIELKDESYEVFGFGEDEPQEQENPPLKMLACKDNSGGLDRLLTEGQFYKCVKEEGNYYILTDNLGTLHAFEKRRFDIVSEYEKPPLGIMPRYRWLELRQEELEAAIDRYVAAKKDIPYEWFAEYSDYIK